jgi:glycerol dehydrogenase
MISVFCAPSRYTQGKNATRQLGLEMKGLGLEGPVFLLAGRTAGALLAPIWKETFAEVGFEYIVEPFGGECSSREIARVERVAREAGARSIVGAGGGKVLDAARAVAAGLGVPVVNCPTVASSDAPCSALSVIYSESGVVEEIRYYPRNPELVLVDTHVVAQGPARLLAAGMGDALATWFEARACADAHAANLRGGASTRSALALARLCYDTLLADGAEALRAAESKAVTPALERIVEANTLLSGLGFESSGLAAAHSVHNGLTVAAPTRAFYHGEKVAIGVLVQLVLEGQARETQHEVLRFSRSVGLPVTLEGIGLAGVTREVVGQIARRATQEGESIHNEPFAVDAEMVADAILDADAMGRAWIAASRRGA